MKTYEISDVRPYEGDKHRSHAKNVTLRTKCKRIDSLCKTVERTTDLKTLSNLGEPVINECYLDLTLDKLRELDDDCGAQESFIRTRARFLDSNNLNLLVVKLKVEKGQEIEEQDYGYILSLLNWSRNDLPLMPILEFGEDVDTPTQVSKYQSFAETIISKRNNYTRLSDLAMSVPIYYPRRRLYKLFELYDDIKPTFVAMDLSNKRVDSVPDGKYDTIRNYFIENNVENTFLYGINVKPYKSGGDSTPALDVQSLHWSFNATGPAHHKPSKRLIIPNTWLSAGRIFDSRSVHYSRFTDDKVSDFIDWTEANYGFAFDREYSNNEKSTYSYLKRYNYESANKELFALSDSLRKGETELIDEVYEKLPDDIKNKKSAH